MEKRYSPAASNARRVAMVNGRPALILNGKNTVPLIYALSDFPGADSRTQQAQKNIRAFGEKGIHLVACDTNLANGWYKTLESEYDALIAEFSYVLDANPKAQILVRLHVNPPYWWLRDHPEELVVYRTPEGDIRGRDNGESDRMIRGDKNMLLRASTASTLWLREAGERLRGFLRRIRGTPEGDALMAVQVAYGLNGEWHQLGTDVSDVMRRYFHEYLKEEYHTIDRLRAAWKAPDVSFETAAFHPEIFQPGDEGLFRDPQKSRAIMDAQKCVQKCNADAIIHFCRIVKEEMGEETLAGAFYGYYLYTGGKGAAIGGHLMPEKLYEAKGIVDFLCGPAPYAENRKPQAVPMQRALLESNRLNGMLWLTEMDQAPEDSYRFPYGGDPAQMHTSIAMMRRNIFMPVLSGEGAWFYDHRVDFTNAGVYRKIGWWDNEVLMNEIGRMYGVIERSMEKAYRPVADVLFVYDTDQYYIRSEYTQRQYEVYASVLRCGVAADTIYLKDLEKCDIARYRLILFPNAYLLTDEQKRMIQRLTADKQVVWLDAPGYCDGETLGLAHTQALLNMRLQRHGMANGYTTAETLGAERVCDELPENDLRVCVCDDEAETLAVYDDGAVCAARKGNTWYFASPVLTKSGALPAVIASGAHRYCDSEGISVLASGDIVLLYTNQAGEKTLTLRNGKTVVQTLEAYTSLVVDANSGEVLL